MNRRGTELFFVFFFMVGIAGMAAPFSRQLFHELIPFALLLCFAIILVFHGYPYDIRTIAVFSIIGVSGYLIEAAGVNTHIILQVTGTGLLWVLCYSTLPCLSG